MKRGGRKRREKKNIEKGNRKYENKVRKTDGTRWEEKGKEKKHVED